MTAVSSSELVLPTRTGTSNIATLLRGAVVRHRLGRWAQTCAWLQDCRPPQLRRRLIRRTGSVVDMPGQRPTLGTAKTNRSADGDAIAAVVSRQSMKTSEQGGLHG